MADSVNIGDVWGEGVLPYADAPLNFYAQLVQSASGGGADAPRPEPKPSHYTADGVTYVKIAGRYIPAWWLGVGYGVAVLALMVARR